MYRIVVNVSLTTVYMFLVGVCFDVRLLANVSRCRCFRLRRATFFFCVFCFENATFFRGGLPFTAKGA